MGIAQIKAGYAEIQRRRAAHERIAEAHRRGMVTWVGADTLGRRLMWTLPPGQRPSDPMARIVEPG